MAPASRNGAQRSMFDQATEMGAPQLTVAALDALVDLLLSLPIEPPVCTDQVADGADDSFGHEQREDGK